MSYKPADNNILAVHVTSFGDAGPELITSWSKRGFFKSKNEEVSFAVKQGVVLMTVQRFALGLSGPFPAADMPGIKCMVYSFQLENQTLQDIRHGNIAQTLIVFYFPDTLEQAVISRKSQLEHAFLRITAGKQRLSEIHEDFLTLIEVQIHEVLHQKDLILISANIKLILSLKKEMTWSFYAINNTNHQEIAKQLLMALFDKVDSYKRNLSQGLFASSAIEAFNNHLHLKTAIVSNSYGLELDSDVIFFLLPQSYTLEDESFNILEILHHFNDQKPIIVFIENNEELIDNHDVNLTDAQKSLRQLKKQILEETNVSILISTGVIDQKMLLEAMKWSLSQLARKLNIQIVQFDHLARGQHNR
ncbi:MAG: hypothetical protein ACXAEU_09540 [Candidatus Hodarchaeales archaeon]